MSFKVSGLIIDSCNWILCAGLLVPALATPPSESPYSPSQSSIFGQIRTRTEFDHKALADTSINKTLVNTQLRSRLGFVATPSENVEVKIELQDVRFMGGEPNTPATATTAAQTATTGNAKGVDLLQGYVLVQEGGIKVALGRQKMSLGAGRFLSTLEWSPTSRSFDGISGNWTLGAGDLTALYFLVRDTNTGVTNDRLSLSGLNYDYKFGELFTEDVAVFYDQSRLKNVYSGDALHQYDFIYLDERIVGKRALIAYEGEFIWQGGVARDTAAISKRLTSNAFQAALRVGVVTPKIKANVGLDMMSGDSKPADGNTNLYHANYYFAHAYYGWMDYFGVNPKYGVADYRGDVDAKLWEKAGRSASLKAQYHYFTPESAPSGSDDPYGQEVDAEIHLMLYPKSDITLGAAAFIGGKSAPLLKVAGLTAGQSDKPGYFFYVMPVFNF